MTELRAESAHFLFIFKHPERVVWVLFSSLTYFLSLVKSDFCVQYWTETPWKSSHTFLVLNTVATVWMLPYTIANSGTVYTSSLKLPCPLSYTAFLFLAYSLSPVFCWFFSWIYFLFPLPTVLDFLPKNQAYTFSHLLDISVRWYSVILCIPTQPSLCSIPNFSSPGYYFGSWPPIFGHKSKLESLLQSSASSF